MAVDRLTSLPSAVPTASGTPPTQSWQTDGTAVNPQGNPNASVIWQRVNAHSDIVSAYVFDGSSTSASNADLGPIVSTQVIHDQTVARGGVAHRSVAYIDKPCATSTMVSATISGGSIIVVTATPHLANVNNSVRFTGTSGITGLNSRQIVTAVDSPTQFRIATGSFTGGPASGGSVIVQTGYYGDWHSIWKLVGDVRAVGLESDMNNMYADAPNDVGNVDATFNAAFYASNHLCTVGIFIDSGDSGAAGKYYFPLKFGGNAVVDNYPFIDTTSRTTGNCDFAWIGNDQGIRWADSAGGRWPIIFLGPDNNLAISAPTGQLIKLGPNLADILHIDGSFVTVSKPVVNTPVTFASLPAASSCPGAIACVSDSSTNTWGAIITGGGANRVLAFSNGTNWTVAAK